MVNPLSVFSISTWALVVIDDEETRTVLTELIK